MNGEPRLTHIVDESDTAIRQNYVGPTGGMVCERCNVAYTAPRTGYIQSEYCQQCGGALKLRSKL